MSMIHQIYCTHCTHGNSALGRREGELAERTLGYSVRAGSLEGEALRRAYQRIEPWVYYHLPRDTPDEQKLHLGPATAPRRFFFVPSSEGLQVVGLVCYRPTDCEGRPGSYFAHLLFQEEQEAPARWSPVDVLKLWGATGWVTEDSPDLPMKLEPLASLSDLLRGGVPAVEDALLQSFLRESGDALGSSDAGCVIPARWRAMEPEIRRDWFLRILSAWLQSATADRRPLVLVMEPTLAALVFYGLLRLVPSGALREETSFSTFESDPDRASAFLAATWFWDAEATGRVEVPGWQKPTLNTLLPLEGQQVPSPTRYAQTMVQRLLAQGGDQLESDLRTMATVRISGSKDLDTLVEIDEAVDELIERGSFPAASWRNWPAGIEYLRQKLGQRLSSAEDVKTVLKAVVGGPAHLTVIDLLTTKPAVPGTRRAVVHLLKELPPEKIIGLLKLGGVPDEDKITVLLRHILAHNDLPPGCERLWDEWAAAAEEPRRAGVVLMARVLPKLPAKTMKRFYANVPSHCRHGFLENCLRLVRRKKMKLASLTAMIRAADDEAIFKLIRSGGPRFLETYPKNEPALGEKLVSLLRTLPKHPDDFKERLDLILAGQHLLGDEVYRQAADSWDKCYKAMHDVGRLQRPDAGIPPDKRQPLLIAACREMAMAADRAMTLETMDAEYPATQKRDFLLRIGQRALGGTPLFLPGSWEAEELLRRVDTQLQHHRFPTDPLKKESDKKKEPSKKLTGPEAKSLATTSPWLIAAIVVLLGLITVGIGYGGYWLLTRPSGPARPKRGPRDSMKRKSRAAFQWPHRPGAGQASTQPSLAEAPWPGEPRPGPRTAEVVAGIPSLVHRALIASG